MINIGIVGLDTSHSESFAEVLAERTAVDIVGVWDSGDVRTSSYVDSFCERYEAHRYDDPHEMCDDIDAVMILTVNWDTHCELAVPFLERGVPTMVDKPIAGNLEDIKTIEDAAGGTPFFGGSAVPYHSAVQSLEPNGDDQSLYCIGYDDPFYYGAHLVDTVCNIVDESWVTVSASDNPGSTVDIVFKDGTYANLRLDGPGNKEQFVFLSVGNRSTVVEVGSDPTDMEDMYSTYIDTFLDIATERRVSDTRGLDAAKLLVGVHAALDSNRPIAPESQLLSEWAIEGKSILDGYEPYY